MPKLSAITTDQSQESLPGFHYSAVSVDRLTDASEYTLVGIVVDKTGSVVPFKNDLEAMMGAAVESCQSSPRSINLLIRTTAFNSVFGGGSIEEILGFVPLNSVDTTKFAGTLKPDGGTNLYDATEEMVQAIYMYGKDLYAKKYLSNAIVFIITDGDDNSSSQSTPQSIADAVKTIQQEEILESIRTIVIGINDTDAHMKKRLEDFVKDSKLDEYVSMGQVTKQKLAKLAQFVSRSTSSQSQSLGTGGASQPLSNFTF